MRGRIASALILLLALLHSFEFGPAIDAFDAVSVLCDRFESRDQRTSDAMGGLAAAYPDDAEAKAFYALALAAPPPRATSRSPSPTR